MHLKLTAVVLRAGLAAAGVLLAGSIASAAEPDFMVPLPQSPYRSDTAASPASHPGYVTRVGSVSLASDLLLPVSVSTGMRTAAAGSMANKTLPFTFFPDAQFAIRIKADSRPRPGVLSLNGQAQGQDMATFSLTVTPESYLITFDDSDSRVRYRVVGDTETGVGEVTEIDLRNMPVTLDEPSPVPPAN